jgi:hypothetical protein
MLTVYSSPWISGVNSALTYEDKYGINWILEYRDAEIPIVREEGSMFAYSTYYYESTNASKFQQNKIDYTPEIPSNFGYNTNRTIGDTFAYLPVTRVYMTTTEMTKLYPYSVPVERRAKSFGETDFMRLKNDPTVKLVYSSTEFEVWSLNINHSALTT